MSGLSLQLKQIISGNILLIICSGFYLLWWLAAFKPERSASTLVCGILLGMAFLAGLSGLFFAIRGVNMESGISNKISLGWIVVGGMILYFLLLLGTNLILKRQVTTELLLIVGWAALEFCILDVMYSQHICGSRFAVIIAILIAAVVISSLACYLIYYHLNDQKRYVDGMIPLIEVAIVMLGMTIRMLNSK